MQLGEDPRLDSRVLTGMLKPYGMDKDPPPRDLTADSTREEIIAYMDEAEPKFQGILGVWIKDAPPIEVAQENRTETITGVGGEIKLFITRPVGTACKKLPCLYHIHGGSMTILHAADPNYCYWRERLAATGCVQP
jgi:hypothetical protein